MSTEKKASIDGSMNVRGGFFIGHAPKCVISKEKSIRLGGSEENKEMCSYGIVASDITTVEEVNEIIHQLQTLAVQMADGLQCVNKKIND